MASNRQQLYSMEYINIRNSQSILNHVEMNDVRFTAQIMASWLLEVPLRIAKAGKHFCFDAIFSEEDGASQLNIGTLLQRWPTITQLDFGRRPKPLSVFRPPKEFKFIPKSPSYTDFRYEPSKEKGVSDIIECFPIAFDLFESIKRRCSCICCRQNLSLGEGKSGCLRDSSC